MSLMVQGLITQIEGSFSFISASVVLFVYFGVLYSTLLILLFLIITFSLTFSRFRLLSLAFALYMPYHFIPFPLYCHFLLEYELIFFKRNSFYVFIVLIGNQLDA